MFKGRFDWRESVSSQVTCAVVAPAALAKRHLGAVPGVEAELVAALCHGQLHGGRHAGRQLGVVLRRSKAIFVKQRLSYPTETVLSNKITRDRIVLSFKDSPTKP